MPDNPEEKSSKKFTYENEMDAFETISKGFTQLNSLVENILISIGKAPKRFESSLFLKHMGTLEEEQERTLGLMINITESKITDSGVQLFLNTVELQQIIPEKPGKGNLAIRKMIPDHELCKDK